MDIKKTPVSELIFDMLLEKDFQAKEKLESYIYARMIRYYNLSINQIDLFVNKEKKQIVKRGTNKKNYVFSGTMTLDEMLTLLFNDYNCNSEKNTNLMLSELISIFIIIEKIKQKYQNLVDNDQNKISKIELGIKQNLGNKKLDIIYTYDDQLAQLDSLIQHMEKFNIMIRYLELLSGYLIEEINNIMGVTIIDDIFYDNEFVYNNKLLSSIYEEFDLRNSAIKNIDILTNDINRFSNLGANDVFFNEKLRPLLPKKVKKKTL